jgi:hypothetical protein
MRSSLRVTQTRYSSIEGRSAGGKWAAAVGEWAKRLGKDEKPKETLQIDRLRAEIKLIHGCHQRQFSLGGEIAAGRADPSILVGGQFQN